LTPADLDKLERLIAAVPTGEPPACDCGNVSESERCPHTCAQSHWYYERDRARVALRDWMMDRAPALLTLARRGLRAEREVCGRCAEWKAITFDNTHACMVRLNHATGSYERTTATDFCACWRAKGGE